MDTIRIKSLPGETKVLLSLIAIGIKGGDYYDAWKFVAQNCANGSSQIQGIEFDQDYSILPYSDTFRINIVIESIHILTARVLDVGNAL